MDAFIIQGGVPLEGTVAVSGAKNAALPAMAAALLAEGPVRLENTPRLRDVVTLARVLNHLGVEATWLATNTLELQTRDARPVRAPYELVRRMRASFCVLGPLLARRGRAVVPLPGGCRIGPRPVDLHLKGLAALGAKIEIERGCVHATARRLRGARIDLQGPHDTTVTGTANVLCAAVLAEGVSEIHHAAIEPEIVDLTQLLQKLGARIEGQGTSTLIVTGVERLAGARHRILPDRIEAATLLLAGAITGGRVTVTGIAADLLTDVLATLARMGSTLLKGPESLTLVAPDRPQPTDITALPYPGVPTDVQSQFMALATLADGESRITDRVFQQRFQHVAELVRLGACITQHAGAAHVRGVARLTGAPVEASDLRASAALVLAGLAADGETVVRHIAHLDRGYEQLDLKLNQLGARIRRVGESSAARVAS